MRLTSGDERRPAAVACTALVALAVGGWLGWREATRPRGALPSARLDVDAATAAELEVLPGVGPSLAAAIVADRRAHGPFGGVAALDRVKGVGPALVRKLAPHVR